MSIQIKFEEPGRKLDITVEESNGHLRVDDPHIMAVLSAADTFRVATPVSKIEFSRIGSGWRYDYAITATDGRVWHQQVRFDKPGNPDPYMTFDVGDEWRVSEFGRGRALRDALVALVNHWQAVKVEITYS